VLPSCQLLNVVTLETFATNNNNNIIINFVAFTMKDVFEQVSMRNVINFIKENDFTSYSQVCYLLFIVAQ